MANYSQATINSSHRRLGRLLQLALDHKNINSAEEMLRTIKPLARDPSEFIQDMFFTDTTAFHLSHNVWIIRLVVTWRLGIKLQEFTTQIDYDIKLMTTKEVEEVAALIGSQDEEAPDSLEDDDPEFDLIGKSQ